MKCGEIIVIEMRDDVTGTQVESQEILLNLINNLVYSCDFEKNYFLFILSL